MDEHQLPKKNPVLEDFKLHYSNLPANQKRRLYISLIIFAIFLIYIFLHTAPKNFPVGQVITIESGESLKDITETLHKNNIIRSSLAFNTYVMILGGEKSVQAGDYLLDKKEGPFNLAKRFVKGEFHLEVTKITIPEGWNIFEIADYLKSELINFDNTQFIELAKNKEGYLFPDTYFISPAAKPETVIKRMSDNFEYRIESMRALATSTYKFSDVIIMASILEDEARTTESRRIIAGILWKRLTLGMPLQVDSTFSYINGKSTYELTLDDLKIDSPYNTYKYKGLPPTPINNPGEDAIISAITPIKTKYLYFLSSKSGKMYYATTFEQHKRNKELYLNK